MYCLLLCRMLSSPCQLRPLAFPPSIIEPLKRRSSLKLRVLLRYTPSCFSRALIAHRFFAVTPNSTYTFISPL
ncbi:hypothetical protein CC78DRAFT_532025, partial [Lojkania enalia]